MSKSKPIEILKSWHNGRCERILKNENIRNVNKKVDQTLCTYWTTLMK